MSRAVLNSLREERDDLQEVVRGLIEEEDDLTSPTAAAKYLELDNLRLAIEKVNGEVKAHLGNRLDKGELKAQVELRLLCMQHLERYYDALSGTHHLKKGTPIHLQAVRGKQDQEGEKDKDRPPRLEPLPVVRFTGWKITEWFSWKARFDREVRETSLSRAEKFDYLKNRVQNGSPAGRLVSQFAGFAGAFDLAWTALETEYGDTEKVSKVHLQELHELSRTHRILPGSGIESLVRLRSGLKLHIDCLAQLGVKPEEYQDLALRAGRECLPSEVRVRYFRTEESDGEAGPADVSAELKSFLEFLDREIKARKKAKDFEARQVGTEAGERPAPTPQTRGAQWRGRPWNRRYNPRGGQVSSGSRPHAQFCETDEATIAKGSLNMSAGVCRPPRGQPRNAM
jgi:Protein of unknown function (DUF1759)